MSERSAGDNLIQRLLRPQPFRELFRTLADSLEDAVLVLNPKDQSILAVNHPFLLLTGYARSDVPDLLVSDIFAGDEGARTLSSFQSNPETIKRTLQEVPWMTREGKIDRVDIDAMAVGSPLSAILLIARSSTHRIARQEHRLAQVHRLEHLLELIRTMVNTPADPLSAFKDAGRRLMNAAVLGHYRISASDPEYLRHGSLPEEFPPTLHLEEFERLEHPTSWRIGTRPDHPLQKTARSLQLAHLKTTPIGSPEAWIGLVVCGWSESSSIPEDAELMMNLLADLIHIALLITLQRISLADIEREIVELREEFSAYFDSVSDALLSLDSELEIHRANARVGDMLGYGQDELIGRSIQEVLIGPPDVMSILLDVQGHSRPTERNHMTIHRRDGTPFPVHFRAIPLPFSPNPHLLLLLTDQSEQQAIEDQTEMLAQRALLGEVTAIFAHEVRNPINNISTGIQLVSSRLGEEHPQREALDRIRNECTRLDQLMKDVLFFARPLELKIQPLAVDELMERILLRWEPRFNQAGITLHTSYEEGAPAAMGDPRTLEQVIINLITNAVQAMEGGGTLSATVAPRRTTQGEMIELKIADTGPGIRQDLIDRIFDPFFTTKKEGTGLGLAISRRIMMAHKGGINVETFPDAGTVFQLLIPAAHDEEDMDRK